MASFTDHEGPAPYPTRETPSGKRGLLSRWFRPSPSGPAEAPSKGVNGAVPPIAAAAQMRAPVESARSRPEPSAEPPRASWEDLLRERRETAEREFRLRQQQEQERARTQLSHAASGEMLPEQAREILSLGPTATAAEIRDAYETMMNCKHPDVRGSEFLTKLAATARDTLLQPPPPSS